MANPLVAPPSAAMGSDSKAMRLLDSIHDLCNRPFCYSQIELHKDCYVLKGSPDGQIDHVLQEKTFQHPYLSALGSHTNYWRDDDTVLFILKHLYRDIPEEPPDNETERMPIRLFYVRDPIAEDIPLTFSDSSLVRELSRKLWCINRRCMLQLTELLKREAHAGWSEVKQEWRQGHGGTLASSTGTGRVARTSSGASCMANTIFLEN